MKEDIKYAICDGDMELSPYKKMDMLDDQQIVCEILRDTTSNVAKKLFYSLSGAEGLSKKGVDECINAYARSHNVSFTEKHAQVLPCPLDPEYVLFSAEVEEHKEIEGKKVHVQTVVGSKRQWTKFKKKDKSIHDDPFWFEKGTAKALRNAKIRLIPIQNQIDLLEQAKAASSSRNAYNRQHQNRGQQQQQIPQNQQRQIEPPKPTVEQLLQNREWMKRTMPWNINAIIGEETRYNITCKWDEIERYDGIRTRKGEIVGVRRYLHMCEGTENGVYFTAALKILKEQQQSSENEQGKLFDNAQEQQQHNDPEDVEVSA